MRKLYGLGNKVHKQPLKDMWPWKDEKSMNNNNWGR
jgi:hypothetical protein